MATKIDAVSARDKLKIRREPSWHRVSKGCFLDDSKMISGPGETWVVRVFEQAAGKQSYNALDDFSDLAGNLRFDVAQTVAQAWLVHRNLGGDATVITVYEVCKRFLENQSNEGKDAGAKGAEARFFRRMYPDKKLNSTPIIKLTKGQVEDCRTKLSKTPAILQDKTKVGT